MKCKMWPCCLVLHTRFAVVIVVCAGLTCISPSFVGTGKVIFGICTAWKSDGTLLDICLRTANVGELDDDAAWGLARICINCLNGDLNSSKVFETQHKLPMSEQESKTHPSRQHY